MSRSVRHFVATSEFNLSYSPELINWGKNRRFVVTCDQDTWRMASKTIGHLFHATWSFLHNLANSGQNRRFFVQCDLEICWMILQNNMSPLHCYVKLCASFPSHRWIVTEVSVRKRSSRETIGSFCRVWPWNATYDLEKNNRGSFLSCVKQCTSFRSHRCILTGDTVRKHSIRAKFLPLWPWKSRDDLQKQ